jgi:DNA mismatch endonuclease (patch repair protein)
VKNAIAPPASDSATRARMIAQRRRDTDCEMAIRRILHRAGFRYRVDAALIPNSRLRADIVFPSTRVAVFVDGCFWHGCPIHGSLPRRNASWWRQKLAYNQRKDMRSSLLHEEAGWKVLRYWSHDAPTVVAAELMEVLRARRLTQ